MCSFIFFLKIHSHCNLFSYIVEIGGHHLFSKSKVKTAALANLHNAGVSQYHITLFAIKPTLNAKQRGTMLTSFLCTHLI